MITEAQLETATRAVDAVLTRQIQEDFCRPDESEDECGIWSHWRSLTDSPYGEDEEAEREEWFERSREQWEELKEAVRAGLEAFVSVRETI
jgi:hypothetical protein